MRTPATMPQALRELTGYDAVILSDVPAHNWETHGWRPSVITSGSWAADSS